MQKSRTTKAKSTKSAKKKARTVKGKSERMLEDMTPEEIASLAWQKSYENRQRQSRKSAAAPAKRKKAVPEEEDRQADELLLQIWRKVYDRHHPVAQSE